MYIDYSHTWVVDGSLKSRELRTCVDITEFSITGTASIMMWTCFHCEKAYFALLVFVVAFLKRLPMHAEAIVASSADHEL